jgi:3-methyladenine DNA glycosylase/8-oxoguanine DNA glycosylase
MLASSIINQQVSTKAAAAIKRQLAEIIPSPVCA